MGGFRERLSSRDNLGRGVLSACVFVSMSRFFLLLLQRWLRMLPQRSSLAKNELRKNSPLLSSKTKNVLPKNTSKTKKEKKEPRRGSCVLFFFSSVHFFSRKITILKKVRTKVKKKSLDLLPLVVLYKAAGMYHIVLKNKKTKKLKKKRFDCVFLFSMLFSSRSCLLFEQKNLATRRSATKV